VIEKVPVKILNLEESVSKTFEIQVQVLIPSRWIVVHLVVGLVAARKGTMAGFIKRRYKFVAIQSLVAVHSLSSCRITSTTALATELVLALCKAHEEIMNEDKKYWRFDSISIIPVIFEKQWK
jgi:hypothetical protein